MCKLQKLSSGVHCLLFRLTEAFFSYRGCRRGGLRVLRFHDLHRLNGIPLTAHLAVGGFRSVEGFPEELRERGKMISLSRKSNVIRKTLNEKYRYEV